MVSSLHSNMVRFIINIDIIPINLNFWVYIPIWLDLLFNSKVRFNSVIKGLHSNMVRFIIQAC